MKRLFILLLISTPFFASLLAQEKEFQKEFYIGAGGGGIASTVSFMPSIPQTQKFSYQGGIAMKFVSEKHLGLITELNLTKKGWSEEFDPESGFSYERALTYIDLPFMTHVYFGKKTRFILNAGPQVSFLIGEKSNMSQALSADIEARQQANPDARIGEQYKPMSEMKRIDYGLIGGVGLELKTGIGDFDLEGRYYFGLGDVFTSRRSEEAFFSRSAHRVIAAKLTYYIRVR